MISSSFTDLLRCGLKSKFGAPQHGYALEGCDLSLEMLHLSQLLMVKNSWLRVFLTSVRLLTSLESLERNYSFHQNIL